MPGRSRSHPRPTDDGAAGDGLPGAVPDGGLLLIDWTCGFCQRTRAWIERHTSEPRFVFRALADEEGKAWLARCGRDPEDRSSVVFVEIENGRPRCCSESTAVLRVLRQMDRPYRWLYAGIVVPRPLRDAVYRWVSRHRDRRPFRPKS